MTDSGLQFSGEALLNRVKFYEGLNDINLYVEDIDSQYMYESIFKRLLGMDYTISTIFPCGGKLGVINAYGEYGTHTNGVANVYVVDGDFDWLIRPKSMVCDPQFIYLRMYNIESCIINEAGAHEFSKPILKLMDDEVDKRIRYGEWRRRIIDEAKELFLCYCSIQKLQLDSPNVARSDYEFIDHMTGFKRMDGAFEGYRKKLLDVHPEMKGEIETVRREVERKCDGRFDRLICGKFLLSSLLSYLTGILDRPIRRDELLWRMVETFDVEELDYVRQACLTAAQNATGVEKIAS